MCQFCDDLQEVHVYVSLDANDKPPEEFKEIKNHKIIELLEKWFLGILDTKKGKNCPESDSFFHHHVNDPKSPVVFGSATNWKVLEMVPQELYTLQLLRMNLITVRESGEIDTFTDQSLKKYIEMIFVNLDSYKIDLIRDS